MNKSQSMKIVGILFGVIFLINLASALDFGGMYSKNILTDSCIRTNPATSACSCPNDYTSVQTWGFDTIDNSYPNDNKVFYCYREHQEGRNGFYDFGGIWGEPSAAYKNPATNSKSCPGGYTTQQLTGVAGTDYNSYYCYKPYTGSPALDFGGMAGSYYWADPNHYPNPITGNSNCPTNYAKYLFLGTNNIDWNLYLCYRNLTNTNPNENPTFNLTGITNVSSLVGTNWIFLNWTNPPQLLNNVLFLNSTNVANTTGNSFNFTGLLPNTTYSIRVHSLSTNSSINFIDFSINLTTLSLIPAPFVVSSVSSLRVSSRGTNFITWTWANPTSNFDRAILYLDDVNVDNITANSFTARNLHEDTDYTITIHTRGTNGIINNSNVRNTARTDEEEEDDENDEDTGRNVRNTITSQQAADILEPVQSIVIRRTIDNSQGNSISLNQENKKQNNAYAWLIIMLVGIIILVILIIIFLLRRQ